MSEADRRIAALAETARAWRDPEHAPRREAAARTLAANPLFTEEAVAFALNQASHAATEPALRRWLGEAGASAPALVGVWADDPEPLAGWRDLLAVVLMGHRAAVRLPETSPSLLPAFYRAVRERDPSVAVAFSEAWAALPDGIAAVFGEGSDEAMGALAALCDAAGLAPERRRLRGEHLTVAVLDGRETAEERIGLAEDALLYAEARRRPALVWAPAGLSPDPLLDAFGGFREVFPAPAALEGRLQMPRAFLKAAGTAHAWGDGFLVSKGPPEPQSAGHLRWSEYDDLAAVQAWLGAHPVGLVVAAPRVTERLAWSGAWVAPGEAHRPRLDGPGPFDLLRAL